ncbi:putative alpha/beta hydrolase-1 [Helianthus annuus]|uniref:Alpha/beta hydrolase-1 n=1 Tax=Helianthus annuus TaxID=4232 RepID=A0A251UDD6_HELAN|nr:methylesterase 10 [Helianthus annuus]KAF5799844.1 putative alpha/beta hydrolase-1 [Helianthus annuus]
MPTIAASRKHLVLVHGLCHGAWCWYKVMTHLRSAGHRVSAVDLGGSGVHPSRLDEIATFSDYIQPLVRFLESLSADEKVVLVGHSYGGLAISLAMERFPNIVSVAVFITAYMPNYKDPPALQMTQYFKNLKPDTCMDCRFTFKNGSPAYGELGSNYLDTMMYHNCQPEDMALANMLIRPSHFFLEDMSKDSLLTSDRYGSISRVYVVCEGDRVMDEEFQRFVIKDSPPKEVKSFPGVGHMIMLSHSKDISLYLQEIADRYS